MAETKRCPKCNSILIKSNQFMTLPVTTNAGTEMEPRFILTGAAGVIVYPYLCGSCGFVEIYSAGSTARSKNAEHSN